MNSGSDKFPRTKSHRVLERWFVVIWLGGTAAILTAGLIIGIALYILARTSLSL